MDASQYKDYVLFMLFIKYISDKYSDSDDFARPVTIPKGVSFKDMIALKGKSDIGDKINMWITQPLIDANTRLARGNFLDFNDPHKIKVQANGPHITKAFWRTQTASYCAAEKKGVSPHAFIVHA